MNNFQFLFYYVGHFLLHMAALVVEFYRFFVCLLLLFVLMLIWSVQSVAGFDCDKNRTDEMTCLACNIYHEARNQPVKGQIAVGFVTLNRVESSKFPENFCKVVWQKYQFSWTIDGKHDRIYEKNAWRKATTISEIIYESYLINDKILDFTKGSVYYHAYYIEEPYWVRSIEYIITIDSHIFYR